MAQLPIPIDPMQLQQFDPEVYITEKQIELADKEQARYGTGIEQAKALGESLSRSFSLGASDQGLVRSGLGKPEDIKGRQQANPGLEMIGSIIGGGTLAAMTGGLGAAAIETALGKGLAGAALGHGTAGALFGAGNAISEQAIGDPNITAGKVLAHIGTGAALGAGLGLFSKALGHTPALLRKAKNAFVPRGTKNIPTPKAEPGAPGEVYDIPIKSGTPKTLKEMNDFIQNRIKSGESGLLELPQKTEVLEANNRLSPEMTFKLTPLQIDSLESQDKRNVFKTFVDTPGKTGEILRNWQAEQKKDLINILDTTIKDIAPKHNVSTDAFKAGEHAAEALTQEVEGIRARLLPALKQIKATTLNEMEHLPGVISYLTDPAASKYANPKIAGMFDISGNVIKIKPYSAVPGIDKATYQAVKETVGFLEHNPKDFPQLFDIRKRLSQHVDIMKKGEAATEIASAKAAMMDYIQDMVQTREPNLGVREVFKNYAINEQNAEYIEKKLGARIGADNYRSAAKGKAREDILDNIFKDSETVKRVKELLPENKFNKILADYLAITKKTMTDTGVFSSNNFNRWMKRNQYPLNEAFSKNGGALQKIKDTITLSRIFPDAKPMNPSATTKTALQYFMNAGLDPAKHMAHLLEYGKKELDQLLLARRVNEGLAGVDNLESQLSLIKGAVEKVTTLIEEGAKSIFNQKAKDFTRGAILSTSTHVSDKMYDEHVKEIQTFSVDPQALMDHLSDNSEDMYSAAPNVTQALYSSVMQGVGFLDSKIPKSPVNYPLSEEWEPSVSQMRQFNQYYAAVNEPLKVFPEIKNGSLSHEYMESLSIVHPHLLEEMRLRVIEELGEQDASKVPYSTKISLSKFLGEPMDESLTPQGLISNQVALNANLSQQSAPQEGRKSTLGGLKQLNFSSRTQTMGSQTTENQD